MPLITIAAITKKRVIGKGLHIPWHIPEDFRNFKAITSGHPVIMGWNTYVSLGRPLPNRRNIAVCDKPQSAEGVEVYSSIADAIAAAKKGYEGDIFIIGGASIYRQTLPLVDKMYLSIVKKDYEGDIFFPEWNKDEWEIEKEEDHGEFVFTVFRRKK